MSLVATAGVSQVVGLAAARSAFARGERDISKLTDIVFFARHPERRGRKLDWKERPLVQEWLRIRDQVIRPMVAAVPGTNGKRAAAPATPRPGAGPAWRPRPGDVRIFQRLLPLIEKYRGDMPLAFTLGWIKVESGGQVGRTTKYDERGFFQLHPGESQALKADHRRLSTDPDYSMRMGIELMKLRAKGAEKLGFGRDSALFWRIVKFLHWVPGGVAVILDEMKKAGIAPTSWDAIRTYATQHRDRLRRMFKARWDKAYDPLQGTDNVDKVFEQGRALAAALGQGG